MTSAQRFWSLCMGKTYHDDVDASMDMTYQCYNISSLGARSRGNLRKHVISPYNPHYRWWQYLLILLVIYCAWTSPFELGFVRYLPKKFLVIDVIIDFIFMADVGVTFFVPYVDKKSLLLVDGFPEIAKRYLSSWFILDVLSSIPFQLFSLVTNNKLGRGLAYNLLSLLRLWRLRRVNELFARLEKNVHINYFWIRCLKLFCAALFISHFAGCSFYLLADRYHDPSQTWIGIILPNFKEVSIWIRYDYCMYWSVTTLFTVGYGDEHVVNAGEMIFNICYIIVNFGLNTYLIGNITYLIVQLAQRTRKFRYLMQALLNFGTRNNLPSKLRGRMIDHMKLRLKVENLQQVETMAVLPKAMRTSVCKHLFLPILQKAYLFYGTSYDFMLQLITEVRVEYFAPGEDIILRNEASVEFYIIASGSVDFLMSRDGREQHYGTAQVGDAIGEVASLCYKPQIFSVRSKQLCQLLCINRNVFFDIIQRNIVDGQTVISNLYQFLSESNVLSMLQTPTEVESVMADVDWGIPLSLCFIASKQNSKLLELLLKKGSDPNATDFYGRTPLHIASANGFIDCVHTLLFYGADPDIEDDDGSVPLWEAIQNRHEYVAELLWREGARLAHGKEGNFMCRAAENIGDGGALKDLLKYDCSIDSQNLDGETPLHVAVRVGNVELAMFLLKHGASIEVCDARGFTPFDLAKQTISERKTHGEITGLQNNVAGIPSKDLFSKQTLYTKASLEKPQRNPNFDVFSTQASCSQNIGKNSQSINDLPMQVIIYRYHPKGGHVMRHIGKLVDLPKCLDELLQFAADRFKYLPMKILNDELVEITNIDVVRNGDRLYLVDQEELDRLLSAQEEDIVHR
ncbi:hypothetical protein KP509_20G003900 [Ceratopteris richardii]|uniref:Uncharacterized protein n=1 Tax=Ceratopteris richardii TaxID=49495 RepID=A0A8T2SFK2_CERRI|nr:hypothetical protein KP509_20G003900 [Ceratopteris richardii]